MEFNVERNKSLILWIRKKIHQDEGYINSTWAGISLAPCSTEQTSHALPGRRFILFYLILFIYLIYFFGHTAWHAGS